MTAQSCDPKRPDLTNTTNHTETCFYHAWAKHMSAKNVWSKLVLHKLNLFQNDVEAKLPCSKKYFCTKRFPKRGSDDFATGENGFVSENPSADFGKTLCWSMAPLTNNDSNDHDDDDDEE